MVRSRENGQTENKAVYLALGINMEGRKELLGMWIADTEGAKFWLNVMTEIKNRGVNDIFIACADGLKGFSEAINTVFLNTEIQLCIVHMIRNSLKYVPYKDYKVLLADLKTIYKAHLRLNRIWSFLQQNGTSNIRPYRKYGKRTGK